MTSSRRPKSGLAVLSLVTLLLPATVVIAHAALLPQGPWFDEYIGFTLWRRIGFAGEWFRVLHWNPRPFSEALLYLYWCAVRATGMPLVALAAGTAWAILFIFLLAALKPWQAPGATARWTMLLALPALFLLAAPPEEMFYWPYGTVAYLPALGAACFATIRLAGPGLGERRGWTALTISLIIGATSVEHGAFLAAGMAPFLLFEATFAGGRGSSRLLRVTCASALTFAATTVLVLFWRGRIAHASEAFGNPAITHRVALDLKLAIATLTREFLRPEGMGLGASLVVKTTVFFGARHCLASAWPASPPRRILVALLAALAATAFLSVFGAYYNFGALCCQRMAAYRQAVCLLMLVACAGIFRPARAMPIGVPVMAVTSLINLQPRLVEIGTEYRLAGARAASRNITFATGMAPGPAPLELVVPPRGPVFNYGIFPPGTYKLSPQTPGPSQFPMMYFEKHQMWAHDYVPGEQPPGAK